MEKLYRLPKEFGEKWIIALRSGEYPQSSGSLFNDSGYCCLGVGCSLNGISNDLLFGQGFPKSDWMSADIWAALPDKDGFKNLAYVLAEMNDLKQSFSEIAKWIEENVEFYN